MVGWSRIVGKKSQNMRAKLSVDAYTEMLTIEDNIMDIIVSFTVLICFEALAYHMPDVCPRKLGREVDDVVQHELPYVIKYIGRNASQKFDWSIRHAKFLKIWEDIRLNLVCNFEMVNASEENNGGSTSIGASTSRAQDQIQTTPSGNWDRSNELLNYLEASISNAPAWDDMSQQEHMFDDHSPPLVASVENQGASTSRARDQIQTMPSGVWGRSNEWFNYHETSTSNAEVQEDLPEQVLTTQSREDPSGETNTSYAPKVPPLPHVMHQHRGHEIEGPSHPLVMHQDEGGSQLSAPLDEGHEVGAQDEGDSQTPYEAAPKENRLSKRLKKTPGRFNEFHVSSYSPNSQTLRLRFGDRWVAR